MALFGLFGKKKEEAQEASVKEDLEKGLERSRSGIFGARESSCNGFLPFATSRGS